MAWGRPNILTQLHLSLPQPGTASHRRHPPLQHLLPRFWLRLPGCHLLQASLTHAFRHHQPGEGESAGPPGAGHGGLTLASDCPRVGPPTAVDTGLEAPRTTTLGTTLVYCLMAEGQWGGLGAASICHSSVSRGAFFTPLPPRASVARLLPSSRHGSWEQAACQLQPLGTFPALHTWVPSL